MKAQITGRILRIDETQTWDSGFCKRSMLIEEADQKYENIVEVFAIKEKCGDLDQFSEGQMVTVDVFINFREYNDRHYSDCTIARITHEAGRQDQAPQDEGCPL